MPGGLRNAVLVPAGILLPALATIGIALGVGVMTAWVTFGMYATGVHGIAVRVLNPLILVILVPILSWRVVWRKHITRRRMLTASLIAALVSIVLNFVGTNAFHPSVRTLYGLFLSLCFAVLLAVLCASLARNAVFVLTGTLLPALATIGIALGVGVMTTFVNLRVYGMGVRVLDPLILVILVPILSWRVVWRKHITGRRMLTASLIAALVSIVLDLVGTNALRDVSVRPLYFLFASACFAVLLTVLCAKLGKSGSGTVSRV